MTKSTLRVRVLIGEDGTADRTAVESGREYDLSERHALELVARGHAELLEPPKADAPAKRAETRTSKRPARAEKR